ncbi:30S ribosomal protein S16 [Balneolaceae bacterium ANBcel3]|nr:30S ribosomal protein S16 [Balneolaceae bacterium ANBcel3]
MVRIRLQRHGRKKLPYYHIVVADVRSKRDGRIIEDLGRFSPTQEPNLVQLKEDRVVYWVKNGAQASNAVRTILKKEGIYYRIHLEGWGKSEEEINEIIGKWKQEKGEKQATPVSRSEKMKQQLKAEEEAFRKEQEEKAREEAEKAKAEAEAAEKAKQEEEAEAAKEEAAEETEAKEEAAETSEETESKEEVAEEPAAEEEKPSEEDSEEEKKDK